MTMRAPGRTIIRTQRRARQWAMKSINFSFTAVDHAGMKSIDLLSELETDMGFELSNVTISALNYNVNFRMSGSTEGDDDTVSVGIILVGQDAFTVGALSLPDVTGDHADWMYWSGHTMSSSVGTVDADEQVFNGQLEIRNRSMRKMRENHQVLAMLVGAEVLQTMTIQVFVAGRALVLLP